jgi:hypothetical protein
MSDDERGVQLEKPPQMLTEQIEHDSDVKWWKGKWFWPEINARYIVPPNTAQESTYHGCTGKCIGRRATSFGMSWALIKFDGPLLDTPDLAWIRTIYLLETDD